MTIQTWSPFQYGTFAGTFINNDQFPELNAMLGTLAQKYKVSKNAIAVAWILRHPAHMQVLLGTMTPAHIIDSAKGSDITLPSQEWYDLYLATGMICHNENRLSTVLSAYYELLFIDTRGQFLYYGRLINLLCGGLCTLLTSLY